MINFREDVNITDIEKEYILNNLPSEWETIIKEVNPSNDMEVLLKINAKTIEETNKWIREFQDQTNTTYSVHNTRKCAGERLTYKKFYRCHHNTRRKETYDPVHRKHVKNTKCPSFVMIHIRVTGKRYRGKNQNDKPDPDKPCEIKVRLQHNHSTTDGMAPKFRRVLPEIRNELINLFKQGHTPATALQRLKSDIRINYNNYEEILADRSKCPDYRFCHYIYERYIAKSDEQLDLNEEFLENKLQNYNNIMNDECAKMAVNETGYVICFCPPFVKRVHKHGTSSSTAVFIYTTNISDKKGSKIYILLTYNETGALPLGVIISTSKSTSMILTAFSLLRDMLGDTAFGGNILGPEYFIVDEFLAQQNVLNVLWPQSTVLFGMSFLLRNIWKWLSSSSGKNYINSEDKMKLFIDFYQIAYAPTELEFLSKFDAAKSNALQYDQYLKLLSNYFDKRKLWALCYRSNLFLRGNSTVEKYCETIFRIMKTRDLLRLKSFNIFQSVDYIINNFFLYFEHRLSDAINTGNIDSILEIKEEMPPMDILQKIKILGHNVYLVPGDKTKELTYVVNTDILTCTCFNGYPGTVCKHVQWMCLLLHADIFNKRKLNVATIKDNFNKILKERSETIIENENVDINNKSDLIEFIDVKNSNHSTTHLFDMKNNIFFQDAIIVEVQENIIEDQNQTERENRIKEGKEIWKKMTKIYENFLYDSPEEITTAAKTLALKFEDFQSASDFCSACDKFSSTKTQINRSVQPTTKEVAAATKLLLLSTSNSHNISDQSVVTNSTNKDSEIQSSETGMKRILLLSGNISCVDASSEKRMKFVPIQNVIN